MFSDESALVPRFYYKPNRLIEPHPDLELQNQAIGKLEYFRTALDLKIPDRFINDWDAVSLYHPGGSVDLAHAILLDPEEGAYDLRNPLNELTGKEWTKFTCSWFIFNAIQADLREEREISEDSALHPATYSPTMVKQFIEFFTKKGQKVLDPFAGIGSTLVAASRSNRIGYGVELNETYYNVCLKRAPEFADNVRLGSSEDLESFNFPQFDFSISSPPYWDVLNRSTKNFESKRRAHNLHVSYSNEDNDLGNIDDYDLFIHRTVEIYKKVLNTLKPGSYMVIIVKNVKKNGVMYPIAWDLASKLSKFASLKDEKIWIQDKISLAPYGYPNAWASNILHHYCLIFQKPLEKRKKLNESS